MSLETLFAQRTPEAPSAQKRKTFIAPKIFPVCCSCGLFRDEIRSSPDRERWVTQRSGVEVFDGLWVHGLWLHGAPQDG